MPHFNVWKTGWSGRCFFQFTWPAEQTNPTASPEKRSALPRGWKSIRLMPTCSVAIPAPDSSLRQTWNLKEGNLTGRVHQAQRRPRTASEGKEMKEGSAFFSGRDHIKQKRNHAACTLTKHRYLHRALCSTMHLWYLTLYCSIISVQPSFPTTASSLQEVGQDTPAPHSQELRAWATSYSSWRHVFCSGHSLLTLRGPVEGWGAGESP